MRKPVYAICEQQRCRSVCASAQFDQHLVVRCLVVLQQSLSKSLSFQDGPTGGTLFGNIYQNVYLVP